MNPRRTIRRGSVIAVALALALAASACGSCGSGGSDNATNSNPAARAASNADAGSSPASSAGSGDNDFCAGPGPGNPALAAAAAVNGGAEVAKLKSDINEALASAPSEIKADLQTVADIELPILDRKLPQSQIEQQLADPQVRSALEHIAVWSKDHCSATG